MPLPVTSQRMTSPASGRPRDFSLAVCACRRPDRRRARRNGPACCGRRRAVHARPARRSSAEMLGVADARQLQDVRRADRAGRQDHLARRPRPARRAPPRENSTPIARLPSNRTRCTSALVTSCRFGRFSAGLQIGARGAGAAAAAAGLLAPADAVAGAGRQVVDVLAVFEAELLAGLDHRRADRRAVHLRGEQRPVLAAHLAAFALPALGLAEDRAGNRPTTSRDCRAAPSGRNPRVGRGCRSAR